MKIKQEIKYFQHTVTWGDDSQPKRGTMEIEDTGPKRDWNPAGKTWNPIAPCPASGAGCGKMQDPKGGTSAVFLSRHSTVLASSTSWHQNFMHFPLSGTLISLPGLPLKAGWKLPWPHTACILYACKTSTTRMMPKSALTWAVARPLLHHGHRGLLVPVWLRIKKWIQRN